MIAILSPAKTVRDNDEVAATTLPSSCSKRREGLVARLRKQSAASLKDAMKVSAKIAGDVEGYYASFGSGAAGAACMVYDGPAYKGLDALSLLKADKLDNLQSHLRIISGLYGLLKPLDAIDKYRLCMGLKAYDLYEHWGDSLAQELLEDLQAKLRDEQEKKENKGQVLRPVIVNVASEEYFKAVLNPLKKLPSCPKDILIITCAFKTSGSNSMVYTKKARGLMAHWIALKDIHSSSIGDLAKLREFNLEGYSYKAAQSTETVYVFDRSSAPGGGTKRKKED